ncbi:hypothetical protein H9L12_05515 [Sphingomonas rhizophila]|uniref:Uncharacterized protein n=1 Tax=Sphingomonas rhizophila TaxID=2071607 RepID=A0A7G9SDP3_9SPHN|nr:hypothetical protein [Sphingomonas rhizophila]QNN65968.1 hypothetical protein H9L12_05515 [Sphingomonas rhizophila]
MDETPVQPTKEPAWSAILRSTDFYRDILVTILGVLIALWIGEKADDARWRSKAANASDAIDRELAVSAATFVERALLQPCLTRRLAELDRIVASVRAGQSLPKVGEFGATPYRALESASWDDALNSGAIAYMPEGNKSSLASTYPAIKEFNQNIGEEQRLWYRLRLIENSPGPLSESMVTELATSLKLLTYRVRLNGLIADQLLLMTKGRRIEPDLTAIFGPDATLASLRHDVQKRKICQPLPVG